MSDAGGKMKPEPKPRSNWGSHAYRVLDLIERACPALVDELLER